MGKGFPRSLKRGPETRQELIKKRIVISAEMEFTGVTDTAVFATAVLSDFVEGNVFLLGAVANLTFTGPTSANLTNDYQGDVSIGAAPTADVTLNGAEVNIIPSTAIPAATAEVSSVRSTNATPVVLDNTDGSLEININVSLDANEVTNAEAVTITVTGDLWVVYTMMGDD